MKVYLVYDNIPDGGDCYDFEILKLFDTQDKALTFWNTYERENYASHFLYEGQPKHEPNIKELEVE